MKHKGGMKPFLKWVGGKTKLADQILKYFPDKNDGTYHEPFLGAGGILLAYLEKERPTHRIIASDLNRTLIETWTRVRDDPEGLCLEVQALVEANSGPECYYQVRKDFNEERTPARFVYLNKLCFRGLWREGPNGFNVPYGNYKNPEVINFKNIIEISKVIKNVEFKVGSYTDTLADVKSDDFVYMDPPYAGTFNGYTRGGWNDQTFFDFVKTLPCKHVMSNSNSEIVKNNFKITDTIIARRAITSNDPSKTAKEVIISS
jgi:DNA adenine methylase